MALLLIGIGIAFHPVILSGFRHMPRDPGDTRLINFILEHSYLWIAQATGHTRLWDWPAFHPSANVGASTDLLLGVSPFYWLWRIIGLAPEPAFQAWMLLMSVLNFVAAWSLFRIGLKFDMLAASMGAFIFAFGLPRITQLWHPQLLGEFYSGLALLGLVKTLTDERPTWWSAVWLPAVALEFYSSVYLAWFLVVGLGLAALGACCDAGLRQGMLAAWNRNRGRLLGSAVVSGAGLALLVSHYLAGHGQAPAWGYDTVFWFLPRPQSWLSLGPESWFYGWQSHIALFRMIPNEPEKRLGLGLVTTTLMLHTVWRARHDRDRARLYLLLCGPALALMVAVTLFPGSVSLWRWIHPLIPGASGIRAVSRIGIFLLIPAAWLVARAFADLGARGRTHAAWILAVLVVLEQGQSVSTYDWRQVRQHVDRLSATIPRDCDAFFYSPAASAEAAIGTVPAWRWNIDAMWAAIDTGIPTVNGYSSKPPLGWSLDPTVILGGADDERLRRNLDLWLLQTGESLPDRCWIRDVR